MENKYINLFLNNIWIITALCLFITSTILFLGLGTFSIAPENVEYEYTIDQAGSSVDVYGDMYQYESLNDTEKQIFDSAIGSSDDVREINETSLPDTDLHTIQKGETMYVMTPNEYNETYNLYYPIVVLVMIISSAILLFKT